MNEKPWRKLLAFHHRQWQGVTGVTLFVNTSMKVILLFGVTGEIVWHFIPQWFNPRSFLHQPGRMFLNVIISTPKTKTRKSNSPWEKNGNCSAILMQIYTWLCASGGSCLKASPALIRAVNASAPHSLILEFGCWQTCRRRTTDDGSLNAEMVQGCVSQQCLQMVDGT